jgi:hypothetical protein
MLTENFNDFSKYRMINEIIDPITLSIALGTLGITIGSMLIDMHKEKKTMAMSVEELKDEKTKLENDKFKALKKDQLFKVEKIDKEIEGLDFRIAQIEEDISKKNKMISKEQRRIKREMKDEVKLLSRKDIANAIKSAKKQAKDILL